jgi:hypothetical protein
LDNASSHVVSFAKVGKSCSFSTLKLSNMTLVSLPPKLNATRVVQALDQRYNNIFQSSIQEETFAVAFVTI